MQPGVLPLSYFAHNIFCFPHERLPSAACVQALELFERMERLRLPRDAITYSATISALAKGKQWHAALQVRGNRHA